MVPAVALKAAPSAPVAPPPQPLVAELTESPRSARGGARWSRWRERHWSRSARDDDEPRESRRSAREDDDEPKASRRALHAASDDSESKESAMDIDLPSAKTTHHDTATGMLRINSRPWSQIYIDGKLIGHTPQYGLTLVPGTHNVRLVSEELEMSKSIDVDIEAGTTTTRVENLGE
jgi:hypothetical protein